MSSVQLAYPGEYLEGAAGTEDAYTDKVGGSAVWPAAADLWRTASPPVPVLCGVCGGPTMLLTQLYLPSTKRVRTPSLVWVHACNKAACGLDHANQRWVRATRIRIGMEDDDKEASAATTAAVAASPAAAKPASASAASAAAAAAAAASPSASASAPKSSSTDEWGVKKGGLAWSSSDDDDVPAAAAATPSKSKAKTAKPAGASSSSALDFSLGASDDAESDDDAALNALLAKQSLADSAAKTRKVEASAKASAKAEKQQRKMEERRQAADALREAALAARAAAEEQDAAAASSDASASSTVSASSLAAATSRVIAAATTVFTPFYLAWTAEPPASALELGREMRLLRDYEKRMAEEGADDELAALGSASAAAAASGSSSAKAASSESEGEEDEADNEITREKREDESQAFFDRLARNAEQCVRYYEPTVAAAAAAAAAAASSTSSAAAASSSSSGVLASTAAQSVLLSQCRRCPCCSGPLCVELQLLPRLLYELHVERVSASDPGMDWVAIEVFSCVKQCRKNEYFDEQINVQPPL